jgi:plastocyanin
MEATRQLQRGISSLRGLVALITVCALVAGCAGRGRIVGRVAPSNRDVVIMAWPEDGKDPVPPGTPARVVQTRGRFEPHVLVVQQGTVVEFENRDRVFHNAFSVTPATRFDLGRYRPGQVRQSSFDQAGVVRVFCELHPQESLYVVVVPDRWHTRPGADGGFTLADLPRGSYLLRAWHPRLGDVTQRVDVPAREPAILRFKR